MAGPALYLTCLPSPSTAPIHSLYRLEQHMYLLASSCVPNNFWNPWLSHLLLLSSLWQTLMNNCWNTSIHVLNACCYLHCVILHLSSCTLYHHTSFRFWTLASFIKMKTMDGFWDYHIVVLLYFTSIPVQISHLRPFRVRMLAWKIHSVMRAFFPLHCSTKSLKFTS